MKLFLGLLSISVMCVVAAQRSEVERYEHLKSIAIFDPNVSNESVNQLLRSGLFSDDPTIVGLSLQAINGYAEHVLEDRSGPFGSVPNRTIDQIPGLKQELLDVWRKEHSKHGFNVSEIFQNQILSKEVQTFIQNTSKARTPSPDHLGREISELVEQRIKETHPWIEIPVTLCVFWPEDDNLHELIWEYREKDSSVDSTALLYLLNLGKFVTPEANDYRIDRLVAYPIQTSAYIDRVISLAATGLALSHPPRAIENLIQAGLDHIEPRMAVITTLAGYEDSQLDPYYNRLVSLVMGSPRSGELDESYIRALNRLVPYVSRVLTPVEFPQLAENPLAVDDHHQRFLYLRNEGIFNPQISDEAVIAMLTEGINHADDKVVELALRTLIEYLGAIASSEFMNTPDLYPRRPVHQVPDLRNFLIERYRVSQPQTGFNLDLADLSPDFEAMDSSELDVYFEKVRDLVPLQDAILMVLCRLWPRDHEIHSLVWAYQKDNPSMPASQMLSLLNVGKFDTSEASSYRLSQLDAYAEESGPLGDSLTMLAARGLALGHPENAIPALIETGTKTDHTDTREAILVTLSGYNEAQLEPYGSELRRMVNVPRNSLPFNQKIQAALDRLSAIVNE